MATIASDVSAVPGSWGGRRRRSYQATPTAGAAISGLCPAAAISSISGQQLSAQSIPSRAPNRRQVRRDLRRSSGGATSRWQRVRLRRLTGKCCHATASAVAAATAARGPIVLVARNAPAPTTTATATQTAAQPLATSTLTRPRTPAGLRRAAYRTLGATSGAMTATIARPPSACTPSAPWAACPVTSSTVPSASRPSQPTPATANSQRSGCGTATGTRPATAAPVTRPPPSPARSRAASCRGCAPGSTGPGVPRSPAAGTTTPAPRPAR